MLCNSKDTIKALRTASVHSLLAHQNYPKAVKCPIKIILRQLSPMESERHKVHPGNKMNPGALLWNAYDKLYYDIKNKEL